MESARQIWIGYLLIALNVAVVGVLIWRYRFGCYSDKDYDKIAQHVIRHLYRHRQAEVYEQLDRLRNVNPEDYREDIA